jgi:hypothetical protein
MAKANLAAYATELDERANRMDAEAVRIEVASRGKV